MSTAMSPRIMKRIFMAVIVLIADSVDGFVPATYSSGSRSLSSPQELSYSIGDSDIDAFDSRSLKGRIRDVKLEIMEEEIRRPPSSNFTPEQLIKEIMDGLLNPFYPLPDSGFRLLLRTATKDWRNKILHSIGATDDADLELVASALGASIGRPDNQFAILVGEGETFRLDFTSNPLDFNDGTCWVECRLRDKDNDSLLVVTGWNLWKREDGAWLVDRIDWQDFRDKFRPGIGREEWMRICR
jgi:hypothetical protein